jgi:hypothetical protein
MVHCYPEVEQMKFLATAAWLILIGISVSACESSASDNKPPPFGQSSIDSINKVNKPPYGQSSDRSSQGE